MLPGLPLPVASLSHLIAMKVLSASETRPQDHADLQALLARATAADLEAARGAVRLIVPRGFHRQRDLVADLDRWIVSQRPQKSPWGA